MRRQLGHPHPVALATLRSGTIRGSRVRRLSAHVSRCPQCARACADLDAIAEALTAAPPASLPPSAERRIMSVLATEAEARAAGSYPAGSGMPVVPAPRTSPALEAPAALDKPTLAGGERRWQAIAAVVVPMAACLALLGLGLGYLLGGGGRPTQASGVAGQVPLAGAPRLTSAGASSPPGPPPPGGPPVRPAAIRPRGSAFMVTDTNTRYRKSTLPAQVRNRLAAGGTVRGRPPTETASAPVPATSVSIPNSPPTTAAGTPGGGRTPEVAPSRSLVACVLHVTGNVPPKFVDRGTYQAKPVYVIAVSDEAWVVGIDCTATRPTVITSVRLGNSG